MLVNPSTIKVLSIYLSLNSYFLQVVDTIIFFTNFYSPLVQLKLVWYRYITVTIRQNT